MKTIMKKLIRTFDELLAAAAELPEKKVAVIFANNAETFKAIVEAQEKLNIHCIVSGNLGAIEKGIAEHKGSLEKTTIIESNQPVEALRAAIDLARKGEVDILLKGGVDTSTMMKEVLKDDSGLKTGRLLSDIFLLEYPQYKENKFVMITDGGMTLAPDLMNKVELIRNAVDVAHALGNDNPKVAILSATEFVTPKLQSTIDAAALTKMNERGQITGCTIDGPLALDNALSEEAAREKGLTSPVAGKAQILIASNIEAANSLAKSTTYFGNIRLAHVIIGSRVPILIPSRSDKSDAKVLSIALGVVMSEFMKKKVISY
jgi:phosphate butyryltransferase